jgi:hypothetical protein
MGIRSYARSEQKLRRGDTTGVMTGDISRHGAGRFPAHFQEHAFAETTSDRGCLYEKNGGGRNLFFPATDPDPHSPFLKDELLLARSIRPYPPAARRMMVAPEGTSSS